MSTKNAVLPEYKNFVCSVIRSIFPAYANDEKMVQCGMEGLKKALKTYDAGKWSFSAYCMPFIKAECIAGLQA